MYKVLKIGDKDYKLEYTIEAALYDDCTASLIEFFSKTFGAAEIERISKDASDSEREMMAQAALKNGISGISNMPSLAITVLYAGLLEHHGTGRNGDGTVRNKEDAKDIAREYFIDHAEDGTDTFYDLFQICIEQMGEDGFFKRIGLEKMMNQNQAAKQNRAARRAQSRTSAKSS